MNPADPMHRHELTELGADRLMARQRERRPMRLSCITSPLDAMMRTLTLFPLLFVLLTAQAQTYFYIEEIAVQPSAPTDQDEITLALSGGLSSTGSQVTSATASVSGSTVTISISASSTGGLTVIVPHTELVAVGTLQAGTYQVVIDGQFVGDFAPLPDHEFVVSGGFPCDGLVLSPVRWHALTDTALVVYVDNPTTELFDYPNFILFDAGNDTLAVETVELFGLPGSGSVHYLRIHEDAVVPSSPFMGRLELWTDFTSTLACTWEMEMDLCPPPPCVEVQPFIQNLGGAIASGTFNWGILQNGNVVASGSFVVDDEQQFDADSICLPPGNYSMICGSDGGPSAGALFYGLWAGPGQETPTQPVSDIIPQPIPFSLLLPCFNPTQGVNTPAEAGGMLIRLEADQLVVSTTDDNAELVRVLDMQGRTVFQGRAQARSTRIDTQGWASGIHVVHVLGTDGRSRTTRALIP
jgi:hypothetical protein